MRKTLIVATTAISLTALATEAAAHARLIKSDPRRGAEVSAPKTLSLTFSERIVLAKSSVTLNGPQGHVATGPLKLEPKTRHLVTVPTPPLAPGEYKVNWTMTTEDTHTMQGDFAFKVK